MNMFFFYLTLSEAESKLFRQYFYCKAEEFEHFHFIYNQIWEYKQRLDNENKRHDLTVVMPKNVVIRIELVGNFTNDDLKLLPKGKVTSLIFSIYLRILLLFVTWIYEHDLLLGKLSNKKKVDESIWEAILLVCFQNDVSWKSALEVCYLNDNINNSNNNYNNNIQHWQNNYFVEILNYTCKTD